MIPEDLLARSLEEVRQGKNSLEAILTRLPNETRVEVEPLLRLALQVERLRAEEPVAPSASFRDRLRSQLMDATVEVEPAVYRNGRNGHGSHAPELVPVPPTAPKPVPAPVTPLPQRRVAFTSRWQQVAAAFATGLLLFGTAGIGGVQAAKDSLPDSPLLYNIKLAHEQIRLSLATNDDERVSIYLQITNTRLNELSRATDEGKSDLAHALSRKYEQSLSATTSTIQNHGGDRNAITRTEIAGVVSQQVTSLQDLVKKAPDGTRDAIAIALSAANRVAGDVQVASTPSSSDQTVTPEATSTAVVTDPPPPMPTVTAPDPEPYSGAGPSSGGTLAGAPDTSSSAGREQVAPSPTTGGGFPLPGDKSSSSSGPSSEPGKGLSGSTPDAQPLPPRTGDGPSTAPPVAAQTDPAAPASTETETPTPTPASDPASADAPPPSSNDKPPALSVPPLLPPAETEPPKDGGLSPAPSPGPGKQSLDGGADGGKNGILPSLRPSPAIDIGIGTPGQLPAAQPTPTMPQKATGQVGIYLAGFLDGSAITEDTQKTP